MVFKGEMGELQINILGRSNSETEDYWDGNWLDVEVMIRVMGFKGTYRTNLRIDELQQFYKDVVFVLEGERKQVEFAAMDEGLFLQIEFEPTGTTYLSGRGMDESRNSLNFRFECDENAIEIFVKDFDSELKGYPLVGHL